MPERTKADELKKADAEGRRKARALTRLDVRQFLRHPHLRRRDVAPASMPARCAARCRSPSRARSSPFCRWRSPSPAWPPPTRPRRRTPRATTGEARRQAHDGPQAHRALWPLSRARLRLRAARLDIQQGHRLLRRRPRLLLEALANMFEHDRSAARGEMATRKLVVFRHATALGNAPAHELFERVKTWRVHKGSQHAIGAERTDNWPAGPRASRITRSRSTETICRRASRSSSA